MLNIRFSNVITGDSVEVSASRIARIDGDYLIVGGVTVGKFRNKFWSLVDQPDRLFTDILIVAV